MYVYDANGNPTWYFATLEGSKPNGVLTFTGDLDRPEMGHGSARSRTIRRRSPWLRSGLMTWQKQSGQGGDLTYSVNGVAVTKTGLVRQTTRNDTYAGTYAAGLHAVASNCTNPAKNGTTNAGDTLTITQNGAAISLNLATLGCTLAGTYAQNGQFGTVAGNFSCTNGDMGTFNLSNMNVMPYAMAALLSTSSTVTGCQSAGQMGGVRTDQ